MSMTKCNPKCSIQVLHKSSDLQYISYASYSADEYKLLQVLVQLRTHYDRIINLMISKVA
jgi:hypothetical protein